MKSSSNKIGIAADSIRGKLEIFKANCSNGIFNFSNGLDNYEKLAGVW